ncbi:MAG TPA: aminotransferase class V-fold PLP-dependent enzyme [Myxococcaceae bacterium]|nr:aminotransferase class V-fold PLP-dependent enzyme [Myxococcaceae bacterium]
MDTLGVSPAQFRELAGRTVDLLAHHLGELETARSFPVTSGAETERLFCAPIPEEGMGAAALDALSEVLRHSCPRSPRFFGYVLGAGDPVAALGDLVASVLNQNVTAWRSSPAAVTIERSMVRWLAGALGEPGFSGSLTGGGSSANLMALAMARESRQPANESGARPGAIYASTQVHMSIPKAVALLGLGRAHLRLIPVDAGFRMVPRALEQAIEEDRRAGRNQVAIVATAGTINTGAIDPLEEIGAIARRAGLWLHVDGAYGGLAALAVPEKFAGLTAADSLSLDPHKWLSQPLDCGCLLYRDRTAAQNALAYSGDYTRVLSEDPVEGFAFFEESIELSRRFRALKLWLSLRYHGAAAFRAAIRADLTHARQLAKLVGEAPELELLAPVELSAVCFRHRAGPGASEAEANRFNAAILKKVIARGRVYFSNTTLDGRFALRACFVNHRTEAADVEAIVPEVLAAAHEVRG